MKCVINFCLQMSEQITPKDMDNYTHENGNVFFFQLQLDNIFRRFGYIDALAIL